MKNVAPLLGALLAGAVIVAAPLSIAAAATGPDTPTCPDAKAALVIAVKAATELAPDVYPEDKVPAVAAVTPALLTLVLADEDLGEGGRAVIEKALAAFAAVDKACAPPPTVTPTSTVTVAPTTTAAPTSVAPTTRPRPSGGVETGA